MLLNCALLTMYTYEPVHEIANNVVCATSKASHQPAHTRSLIRAFASSLSIFFIFKLLTEYHLEFLSVKGDCRGSSKSTHVKMPHCWKSHALAQYYSSLCSSPEHTVLLCYCSSDFVLGQLQVRGQSQILCNM